MTKIKICGLSREQDIDYVNQYLPDYAGFILHYPRSHRYISDEECRSLVRLLNPGIPAVGVIVNQPLETAIALLRSGTVDILQLHGQEDEDYIRALQSETGKEVWKAFRIASAADLAAAEGCCADQILLDSGAGSGEVFDWSLLSGFDRPYFLAGGLGPHNAVRAVKQLHPYGLDLSSGVETGKRKDKAKISSVIASVRGIKERKR